MAHWLPVRVDRHFLGVGAGIVVLVIEAVWMIAFNVSVIASASSLHDSLSETFLLQLLLVGLAAIPLLVAVALLKRSVSDGLSLSFTRWSSWWPGPGSP